jgi:hypothetical protein
MALGMLFLMLAWLGTPVAARPQPHEVPWAPDPRWTYVRLAPGTPLFPVRAVDYDEPWTQVVQDVQHRLGVTVAGREVRVGFYGHGAFVTRAAVQQDVPFVAALGMAAEMEVMLLPHWRFPERHPLWELPRQLLHEQFTLPLKLPGETVLAALKRRLQQLALDNRRATAHAAVRLAEGIQAFHRQHMTPALAAFSNSALVIVRLGALLHQGTISDGHAMLMLADDVRQGVAMRNVVMFGYPLPHGTVSTALRHRVQGTVVNIVPTHCWYQLAGNFPLQGSVENVPVAWAPSHAGWPQLAPRGPEVAILGAFLGGRADAGRLAAQLGQRTQPGGSVAKSWWDTVCAQLPVFDTP